MKFIDKGPDSVEEMKHHLKDNALTVALNGSSRAFRHYKSGVVLKDASCSKKVNHAVVLVGYYDKEDEVEPEPEPKECTVERWWYTCEKSKSPKKKDSNGRHSYWKI